MRLYKLDLVKLLSLKNFEQKLKKKKQFLGLNPYFNLLNIYKLFVALKKTNEKLVN